MFQPTEEQIRRIGRMNAAERNAKLREIDAELSSAYVTLKIARTKTATNRTEFLERRIAGIQDEIDRIKRKTERQISLLEKQIKEISEETEALPAIIEGTKRRCTRLEEERALLKAGKHIAALYQMQLQLGEMS